MSVVIVDYGSGNLRSAAKAFERASRQAGLDMDITVTGEPAEVARAERIVLPGVGAFGDCRAGLAARGGMIEALSEAVIGRGRPFLGICVGMQLMADRGLEHGVHQGLGWIAGEVRPLAPGDGALKVPHMGWNDLAFRTPHPLFAGIVAGAHAYFVHSYYVVCADAGQCLATVDYGGPLCAAIGRDNMAGVQFHPEKSQAVGLRLIENFLTWRP